MVSCISGDYKVILTNMLQEEVKYELLSEVVKAIPLCETVAPPTPSAVAEAKKRRVPEPWGIEPVFVDAKGKKTNFSSPSALVRHLDLPMSGIQCDAEGTKCKAMSAVEILQIHGYVVSGDGEPKKAGEGGTKLTVYHPKSVPKE